MSVAVSGVLVAYMLQPTFLYFPRKYSGREQSLIKHEIDRRGLRLKEFNYSVNHLANQRSYLILPGTVRQSARLHLIVFFGGNAMTGFDAIMWFMSIRGYIDDSTEQYALLAIDYPGYGHSDGTPSPDAILDSAQAAFEKAIDYLNDEYGAKPVDVVVVGHSLGSAVATTWLAGNPLSDIPLKTLILSAPFTSVAEMATHLFKVPHFLSWVISRHNWDNTKALKQLLDSNLVQGKVSIIHGTLDEIVPFDMGLELSKISSSKTQLIPLKDYSHNNILDSFKVYAYAISE